MNTVKYPCGRAWRWAQVSGGLRRRDVTPQLGHTNGVATDCAHPHQLREQASAWSAAEMRCSAGQAHAHGLRSTHRTGGVGAWSDVLHQTLNLRYDCMKQPHRLHFLLGTPESAVEASIVKLVPRNDMQLLGWLDVETQATV